MQCIEICIILEGKSIDIPFVGKRRGFDEVLMSSPMNGRESCMSGADLTSHQSAQLCVKTLTSIGVYIQLSVLRRVSIPTASSSRTTKNKGEISKHCWQSKCYQFKYPFGLLSMLYHVTLLREGCLVFFNH